MRTKKKRVKINNNGDGGGDDDRLSNLPESIIHHILSFVDAKQAVQTAVLSKKWRLHWANTPSYSINSASTDSTTISNFLTDRKLLNPTRPIIHVTDNITMESFTTDLFYNYVASCRIENLDITNKVQINDHRLVDRITALPETVMDHILSLADTKTAVQTSVLSRKWRNRWINVHSLNFDCLSFKNYSDFRDFVLNVFNFRKALPLRKLKFFCRQVINLRFVYTVLDYARLFTVQELDTDVMERLYRNKLLTHLRMGGYNWFKTLVNLRISSSALPPLVDFLADDDTSNLECLVLERCSLSSGEFVFLHALHKLVTLSMVEFGPCKHVRIETAPRLKFFHWKGEGPCLLSFVNCLELEEVTVHISPPRGFQATETWFQEMRDMAARFMFANFIKVSLDVREGEFVLYYSSVDAEAKAMEVKKGTRETILLLASPMARGFYPYRFATMLEILLRRKLQINNPMEIDRLSGLPDDVIYNILSFLDTKSAVRTSLLSKAWNKRWTYIHNVNLENRSRTISNFKNFVIRHVLYYRKQRELKRLSYHLKGAKSEPLMRILSVYAIRWGIQELDTNLPDFLPSFHQCRTLRTLKLGSFIGNLPDLTGLSSLMDLELSNLFLGRTLSLICGNLENLSIINCQLICATTLTIVAPQLTKMFLSNLKSHALPCNENYVRLPCLKARIVLSAPRLKFLKMKEVEPIELRADDFPSLEKLDFYLSPPVLHTDDKNKAFIFDKVEMLRGLFHVKFLRFSLNFNKEKFVLYRNGAEDEEAKIIVINKETGEEQLVGLAKMLEGF